MEQIFTTIKQAAIEIRQMLECAHTNYLESQNESGDTQLEIDVKVDNLLEKELLANKSVAGIFSEEKKEPISSDLGQFLVAYDPLDGSSVLKSNFAIGSIFGIYHKNGGFKSDSIVGACYVIYGPRLEFISATKNSVNYQIYNPKNKIWEKQESPKIGKKGSIQATGGSQKNWSKEHAAFVRNLFEEGYQLRYSGAMVADVHQILIKGGGIFSYPATQNAPSGKLRKLFEVFPIAFIYEQCGGFAINGGGEGKKRLLELPISDLHETTPCFFGSEYEISKI
ncbi:MAG: fructose-1,6-bisphosphatase [Helicobacter sp.]|nr:fructose-1,6-bisphosphatase [Helicobacter sp.]